MWPLTIVGQCPEHLPNDEARQAAAKSFLLWIQKHHPDWTINQVIDLRVRLLTSHHSDKTLAAIHERAIDVP